MNMNRIIKNKKIQIVNYLLLIGFAMMTTCKQPDDLKPPVARMGLNSITASFADGTGEFTAENNGRDNELVISIPFFYPESSQNQVTEAMLKNMRVRANLDDNVIVNPTLLYMDLTQSNRITVTDQRKVKKDYIVKGEIRKSNACFIEDFEIPSKSVSGIINETTNTIFLPVFDTSEPLLASIRLSWHATISPDPRVTPLDWSEDQELTVTAHDGITRNVYTVKLQIPDKLPYGIRPGSAKLMFAKQMKADLGVTVDNLTGGMAVTGDYVILNTRNENSIYIDAKTGAKIGEFDLGAVKGSLRNFYTTADAAGNVLICNLTQNDGTFKVWRLTSMTGATELYIDWHENETEAIGRKLSIQGNIDENAIITAPLYTGTNQKFARWTVIDGELTSRTPEIITMSGLVKGWTTNCDIIYTSPTDVNSDYFVASYSDQTFAWVNGLTNQVRKKLDEIEINYIHNAVDYIEFNSAKYVTVNWVNSFTWGASDVVWLLDVSADADFSGNLQEKTCKAVVWECERDIYGPKAIQPVAPNANGTGDVALRVSPDGFYLYLYFMFTNGYVVGYQFDCINM